MILKYFLFLGALVMANPSAKAQAFSADSASPYEASSLTLRQGVASARVSVEPGAYAYKKQLGLFADGQPLEPLSAPKGRLTDDPSFGNVEVIEGEFEFSAPAPGSPARIQSVDQACSITRGICYPARALELDTATGITRELGMAESAELAKKIPAPGEPPPPASLSETKPAFSLASADYFSSLLSGGPLSALALFFFAGVLLSMTPCNWPILPLVARSLLSAEDGSPLRARTRALALASYTLAFCLAYATLGAAAAFAGSGAAELISSSAGTGLMAGALALMGLSSLGLFELRAPSSWGPSRRSPPSENPPSRPPSRIAAAAGNGLMGALLASPCVAAPLAGALLFSAANGSILFAAIALALLGLGLCAPLALIAMIGSSRLPKSGAWTLLIRQLIGWAMLMFAARAASPLLPPTAALALFGFLSISLGLFLWSSAQGASAGGASRAAWRALGMSLALFGSLQIIGAASGGSDPIAPLSTLAGRSASGPEDPPVFKTAPRISSIPELDAFLTQSASRGRPVALLATANWCASCRTLERGTLIDPSTRSSLEGFDLAVADFSDLNKPRSELLKRLVIAGPPALLIYRAGGSQPQSRLSGVFKPRDIATAAALAEAGS